MMVSFFSIFSFSRLSKSIFTEAVLLGKFLFSELAERVVLEEWDDFFEPRRRRRLRFDEEEPLFLFFWTMTLVGWAGGGFDLRLKTEKATCTMSKAQMRKITMVISRNTEFEVAIILSKDFIIFFSTASKSADDISGFSDIFEKEVRYDRVMYDQRQN